MNSELSWPSSDSRKISNGVYSRAIRNSVGIGVRITVAEGYEIPASWAVGIEYDGPTHICHIFSLKVKVTRMIYFNDETHPTRRGQDGLTKKKTRSE